MVRDVISQTFKLYDASLKQGFSFSLASRKYFSGVVIKMQFNTYIKLTSEVHVGSIKYACGVFDFSGQH